uniref:Uncharacterized protein n=1 Tax=Ditylenchus dipsaci TaxID=166011 RepID=A0A915DQT2_9BILA
MEAPALEHPQIVTQQLNAGAETPITTTQVHNYAGKESAHFHRNQPVGENLEFRRNAEGLDSHQFPPIAQLGQQAIVRKKVLEQKKVRRERPHSPKGVRRRRKMKLSTIETQLNRTQKTWTTKKCQNRITKSRCSCFLHFSFFFS